MMELESGTTQLTPKIICLSSECPVTVKEIIFTYLQTALYDVYKYHSLLLLPRQDGIQFEGDG